MVVVIIKCLIFLTLVNFTFAKIFQHEIIKKTKPIKNSQQTIYSDEFYYGARITIGTPGQSFDVRMDMSTTAFWVPNKGCHGYISNPEFNPAKSKTYVRIPNSSWIINLESSDDETEGFMGRDTVQFLNGNNTADTVLRLPHTIFGQATEIQAYQCEEGYICGTLGIGLDTAGGKFPPTIFHHAYKQGLIEKPIFSIYLEQNLKNQSGIITYGGLDSKHCDSTINYYNSSSTKQYQIQINSFGFEKQTFFGNWDAILQPGIGIIRGPSDIIMALYQAVNATKDPLSLMIFIDCNAKIDPIRITFGKEEYLIDEKQMKIPWPYEPHGCTFPFYIADGDYWILGDPWHRSYCNTYNFVEKSIGFSKVIV